VDNLTAFDPLDDEPDEPTTKYGNAGVGR